MKKGASLAHLTGLGLNPGHGILPHGTSCCTKKKKTFMPPVGMHKASGKKKRFGG